MLSQQKMLILMKYKLLVLRFIDDVFCILPKNWSLNQWSPILLPARSFLVWILHLGLWAIWVYFVKDIRSVSSLFFCSRCPVFLAYLLKRLSFLHWFPFVLCQSPVYHNFMVLFVGLYSVTLIYLSSFVNTELSWWL